MAASSSSSVSEVPATIVGAAGRSLRRRSSEDSPSGTSRRLWPQLWSSGHRSPTQTRPSASSPHAQRQSNPTTSVGEPQRAVPAPLSFGALQPAGLTPAMLQSVASPDDNFEDAMVGNFEGRSYEGMHDRMLASLSQPDPLQHVSTSATRPARRVTTAEARLARALAAAEAATSSDDSAEAGEVPFLGCPLTPNPNPTTRPTTKPKPKPKP